MDTTAPPSSPTSPAAAPPRKRRRWLRRLVGLVVVLLLLVALSPLALSIGPVRDFVARQAGEAVGRPVTIRSASAFWGKGIDLEGIVVGSGPGFDGPLATVERVHASVDLLALLGGTVRAAVEVSKPDVTFRRDAAGRGNAEGLFPAKPAKEKPPERPGDTRLDVTLAVKGGSVRSAPSAGRPAEEITGIDATVRVRGGDVEMSLDAVAKGAGRDGKDAPLLARILLAESGEGPLRVEVPSIDLARLSGIVEDATGTTIAGRLTMEATGSTKPGPGIDGKFHLVLEGFSAKRRDGTAVSVDRLDGTATLAKSGDVATADLVLSGDRVTLRTGSGADARSFDEPRLDVTAKIALDAKQDVLRIEAGKVTAGQALSAEVKRPVEVRDGGFSGAADVRANLARLSAIVEKASGWRIEGTLDASVDGSMRTIEDAKGTLRLSGAAIGLSDGAGSRYGVGELGANATFAGSAGATNGTVDVTLRRVQARVRTDEGERALDEPEVRAVARLLRSDDGRIQVEEATVTAGASLQVRTTEPWRIDTSGKTARASGKATLRADLGRLTALRTFAPALASLTAGTLDASVEAAAAEGLDVGLYVRGQGLAFAPGAWSPQGYVEPDAVVRLRFSKPSGADPTIRLHDLRSSVVEIPLDPQKRTLDVTLGEGVGFAGPVHVLVKLEPASRAFGGLLGLAKGERLAGEIRLDGTGNGTPESGGLQATLAGRNLVFPPSWGAGGPPASLDAGITVGFRADGMDVRVADLEGTGFDLDAAATLSKGEDGGLDAATVAGTVDLGAARPWLEPFAKLGKDALLAGVLTIDTRLAAEGTGRRLKGTLRAQGLRYRKDAAGGTLEEPALAVEHDLLLPTGDGRYAFDALRVVASSVSAEVTGGATSSPAGTDLDAGLRLNGDATKLSAQLRAFLGGDSDLQGSGALTGSLTLKGSTAGGGTTLLVNGDVDTGRWATGGFTVERAKLTLRRPTAKDYLAIRLDAGVNTGTAQASANLDLAREGTPWGAQVKLASVDMSSVVVDKGPGRFLTFVLPAVLPANSALPVLSGRLDAQVQMTAGALDAPKRDDTLRGTGTIKMAQGAVKESTLFKSLGGGGLGEVGQVLATAAPEVGQELAGLMRMAAFSSLLSEFEVANRVVLVKNARLESERTSVQMQGRVTFEKQTDLAANLVFSGTAGDRLAKVLPSKTIPLRITGPLEDPRVLPNLSAKDLLTSGALERLPGAIDKIDPKDPLKGLKDLLK